MQKTRGAPSKVPIQKKSESHYLGIFIVLIVSLILFGVYSPVNFRGDITGGQVLNVFSSHTPLSALFLFLLIFGILLLFFFTHRVMSKVI